MKIKKYKLFGRTIFETEILEGENIMVWEEKKGKQPQGAVLEYTPEQEEQDKERKIIKKMEGNDN